jgi:hypothetical protein
MTNVNLCEYQDQQVRQWDFIFQNSMHEWHSQHYKTLYKSI